MPAELEKIYGRLGLADREVYANFVASIDGVVSLGDKPSAGSEISRRNQADRFLMGLLRAFSDAVLLGAGTLRATPGHDWTAEHVFPDLASAYAELRQDLGRKPRPRLILLTASGNIEVSHPAVGGGATVLTTSAGAAHLKHRLPDSCDIIELGDEGSVDLALALEKLRARGYGAILTEGGPHVMGELIAARLLDEVFLTMSPVIAGRGDDTRLGMVAGAEFLPSDGVWSKLVSARRHGDYMFLRYRLR